MQPAEYPPMTQGGPGHGSLTADQGLTRETDFADAAMLQLKSVQQTMANQPPRRREHDSEIAAVRRLAPNKLVGWRGETVGLGMNGYLSDVVPSRQG